MNPNRECYFLNIVSVAILRTTSLATGSPPVSHSKSANKLKSFLFTLAIAWKAARVLPQGSLIIPPNLTTQYLTRDSFYGEISSHEYSTQQTAINGYLFL